MVSIILLEALCKTAVGIHIYADSIVDFVDFSLLTAHWQETKCSEYNGADFTYDGNVDMDDLSELAANGLFAEKTDAWQITDDFSDNSGIAYMEGLHLDMDISLARALNDINDPDYLLLYSQLGSDSEIISPVVGYVGDPYHYYSFDNSKHYDYDSAMVGWWSFTADANDASGYENDGIVYNATLIGQHYEFDGMADYIDAGNSESLNIASNITISAWVRTNSDGRIISHKGSDNAGYELYIANGKGVIYVSNVADYETTYSGTDVTDNIWHHIVATNDGTANRIYIDGCLEMYEPTTILIGSRDNNLFIGRYSKREAAYFSGSIDEVAIYSRVLSSKEILAQYQNTARSVSNIGYISGIIGNGCYLNAGIELTFSGDDFHAPKGTIGFWASLPDWSFHNGQYFFYAADDSGNYIKISKPSLKGGKVYFFFIDRLGNHAYSFSRSVTEFDPYSWHDFVFTWDINRDYISCFVDNQAIKNGAIYKGWNDKADWEKAFGSFRPTALWIGRSNVSGHELNGYVDELRNFAESYWPTTYPSKEAILESIAFDTGVANPVWGEISWSEKLEDKTDIELQISVSDDSIKWTNWAGLSKGLVTLTFDDGSYSHYTNAFPAMDNYNYKGVVYVVTDFIGGSHMDATELLSLQDAGWEIGGHSKDFLDLTALTENELITKINESHSYFVNLGLRQEHFAYPGGRYNSAVENIVSGYYSTGRTTECGFNTYNTKYKLKIQNGSEDISAVKAYIDQAATDNSWLILMFHKIGEPGGVNMSNFYDILYYLNSSNVDVVTIGKALENISSYTNHLGEQIKAPSKRYVKYRAILYSYGGSNTPILDNIEIQYFR